MWIAVVSLTLAEDRRQLQGLYHSMTVVQDNNVFKDFLLWYQASFSCDIASSFRFTQDVHIRHGLCKEQSRDYILGILYIERVCRHTGLVELDTLGQP